MKYQSAALSAALIVMPLCAQASCGSAFCTVNTSFDVQGAWTGSGARFDLRYEYINQNQPRSGSTKVSVGQLPRDHDEVSTANRNLLANFDYAFDATWGVGVSAPMVDRNHFHFDNDTGTRVPQAWRIAEPGDVRVLGRYRFAPTASEDQVIQGGGLNFGLKLPTGRTGVRNAAGDRAERSLQPGTGTTDAIVGAFYNRALPMADLSFFAQALFQAPLNSRADYRPGRRLSLDAGVRYQVNDATALMLQANALFRGKDSGGQAEPGDSGGRAWYLSPGFSYAFTRDLQAYAFLQLPLYQYVNGVQLTASKSAVIGMSANF